MKKQTIKTKILILAGTGLILSMTGCKAEPEETKDNSTKEPPVAVTTEAPAQDFTVTGLFPTMIVGENKALTITGGEELTYESSNPDIVTVENGTLTAQMPGKAVITISDPTGTAYVHVKVIEGVEEQEEETAEGTENQDSTGETKTETTGQQTTAKTGTATGTGTGTTGSTGGTGSAGKTNTTTASQPTPSTPATPSTPSAPATTEAQAPAQTTVYYYNWDYIIPRANEIIKQNYPNITIARYYTNYQSFCRYDGLSTPLGFTDESMAQDLANCAMSSMGEDHTISGEYGVFVDSIVSKNTDPNNPSLREITITYYY